MAPAWHTLLAGPFCPLISRFHVPLGSCCSAFSQARPWHCHPGSLGVLLQSSVLVPLLLSSCVLHLDIPQTPQTRWTRSGGMAVDSDISNSACLKSESITVLSWWVRFQSLGGLNQKPLSSFRSFFLPYNRRQSATSHVRSPSQFLKYVSSFSVLLSERFASSSPVCFAVSCPSHPSPPPHSVLRPVAGQGCLTADLVGPP